MWQKLGRVFRSPELCSLTATSKDLSQDALTAELDSSINQEFLSQAVKLILPWRVGPYKLGDLFVDSEWRSYVKWHRIAPLLPKHTGLRIADVGCSNGYFLFRMAHELKAEVALGFDPIDRCWLQFHLLQRIFGVPQAGFVPLGLNSLTHFKRFFDLTVCMGVLYHQRDPYLATRALVDATKPGGTVVLESLSINTDEPTLLIPKERYAKMRNAWIIPSPTALANLLERAGCKEVVIHRLGPITTEEQRRTPFAPYESLADFLDPHDQSKTIEGYPAPHSALVIGTTRD
jgi:tRNA (mo5U34)-methyltransferase